MNQDFNLLDSAPRSAQRSPSIEQLGWLAGAVLAIGIVSGVWLDWRADAAEQRIEQANAAIEDLVLSLQERSQFLAQRNADPALVGRLRQLERESTDKGRVLDLLSGRTLGNTAGFSAHLAALGRRHPDGLWLRHVQIGDGGRQISLRGQAVSADLVPRFIDALQNEPAFQGAAFEQLEMTRRADGGGTVSFALATACSSTGTDGAADSVVIDCFPAAVEDAS